MKKLLNVLLLLSLLLVLNVKADMGPPVFPKLKGEVKNDNTKCYKDLEFTEVDKVLEKGKVIEVENYGAGEYSYNYCQTEDEEDCSCYIKLENLNFENQKYEFAEEDKLEKQLDLMVVQSKGVEMYKGPSSFYEKLNKTIPSGTKLKTQYRMGDFWYYVTYDGVTGYVSSEENAIVNNEYQDKLFTVAKIDISGDSDKVVGTIPANTLVEINWKTDYSRHYYVEYNGVKGLVGSFDGFAEECKGGTIEALGDLNVYDNLGEERKKISSISKGKKYSVDYYYIFYEAQGFYIPELKGWVYNQISEDKYLDDNKFVKFTNSNGETPLEDLVIFEKIEVKGHDIGFSRESISYDIELNEGETKLDFVVTPSEVEVEVLNNEDLKNNSVVTVIVRDSKEEYTYIFKIKTKGNNGDVDPTKSDPDPDSGSKKDGIKLTNEELIMICVGAGIVIAVTILVIIKLVNKKKEVEPVPVKNDDNKEGE